MILPNKLLNNSRGASIFLVPKVAVGDQIDLTIITSNGKAQDLQLQIDSGKGKSIVIDSSITKESLAEKKLIEAKYMIKTMLRGGNGKYNVTDFATKNVIASSILDLEIKEMKLYRYDLCRLKGLVLNIKNINKSSISFDREMLTQIFPGTLLVSIGYSNLNDIKPGNSITAYVAIEEKEEE